jgi:hypothetical protein
MSSIITNAVGSTSNNDQQPLIIIHDNDQNDYEHRMLSSSSSSRYLRATSFTKTRRMKSKSRKTHENQQVEQDNIFVHHNVSDVHSSSSSSSKSSKRDKSSKSSKSSKRSKGIGEGDNSAPVPSPTPSPSPVSEPSEHPLIPPSNPVPTRPRPGSGDPPAGIDDEALCSTDSSGLYGSQLGFAEVSEYSYQVTTIPSVTAEELDLFVLSNVEEALARGVLQQLFEECNPSTTTTTSVSRGGSTGTTDSATEMMEAKGFVLVGGTWVYQPNGRRHLQTSPPQRVEGLSNLPEDTVAVGVDCVEQGIPSLNCFVVRGSLTTYTREKQTDEMRQYVQSAITTTLLEASSALEKSDSRLLEIAYRDLERFPIPDAEDSPQNSPTPAPIAVQPQPQEESSFGEPWHYALIGAVVFMILVTLFLCFRRPSMKKFVSDDEQDDESSSSSSSSRSSGHESVQDDDVDMVAAAQSAFGVRRSAPEPAPAPASSFGAAAYQQNSNLGSPMEEDHEEEEEDYDIDVAPDNNNDYDDEDDERSASDGQDEEDYDPEEDQGEELDEDIDDAGEWVEDDNFEDEPTYDERLNDEVSAFGPGAAASSGPAPVSPFGKENRSALPPAQSLEDEETRRSFEVPVEVDDEEEEDDDYEAPMKPPASTTSFSAAIARAMAQASTEKSETEFSPFDQIYDDNIYGATTQEYEFQGAQMPMNSSHHSGASASYEEESYDDEDEEKELDEEEYEIEYATDSGDDEDLEEDFISDGEEEEEYEDEGY